jgi:hypothetical protein
MVDTKVSPEITRALIERQIESWRQAMEDSRIAAIVADTIEDAEMKNRNVEQMTKCVKAIEKLTAMLDEAK